MTGLAREASEQPQDCDILGHFYFLYLACNHDPYQYEYRQYMKGIGSSGFGYSINVEESAFITPVDFRWM